MSVRVPTSADTEILDCLERDRSFALIAGAGSGKTSSLIQALDEIRTRRGKTLRQNGQRVACLTYTKRAVEVIKSRLGFDELYHVSTLHGFLWAEIGRFHDDIRDALLKSRLPNQIAKHREKDTGRDTQEARKAREQIAQLKVDLESLPQVSVFAYDDSAFSDYSNGLLNHDDIIEIAGFLLAYRPNLRRILGLKYPYIFVDEAQDTFEPIIQGLNLVCGEPGLPLVGYFGDPWQQIYEGRAGQFSPPPGGLTITKKENFRCSQQVIDLLNAFRTDVRQEPAGKNKEVEGSVEIQLVRAENPEAPRKRYSDAQLERALARMDLALAAWGWNDREDIMRLFLARQMIARRLKFSNLHDLFTGDYASSRAQDDYESGEHYLLKPFIKLVCPLMTAYDNKDSRKIIDILRSESPAFSITGPNANRTLKAMIDQSNKNLKGLSSLWKTGTIKDILLYCRKHELLKLPDRLREQLIRPPRAEPYNEQTHGAEKGDWLADSFFAMNAKELPAYCNFMSENSAYSTQHGVKGEEYPNVVVVFDDVEAGWNHYNFTKLLTPKTAGEPTEGQRERGRKLAYVCFSRAEVNLRILLFTPSPEEAHKELLEKKLFKEAQITIA